jgi:hypothetical protein
VLQIESSTFQLADIDQFTIHSMLISAADPGSGAFLTTRSGMGKNPGQGSRMNILDHFSETLETVFRAKKVFLFIFIRIHIKKFKYKFFDEDPDPGSGSF